LNCPSSCQTKSRISPYFLVFGNGPEADSVEAAGCRTYQPVFGLWTEGGGRSTLTGLLPTCDHLSEQKQKYVCV